MNSEECVFCRIINGLIPCSRVFEDDSILAFMDIQPINPGHVLVIPKTHASGLSELPETYGAKMFNVGQNISAKIRSSGLLCEGINLYLADGKVAGQEVFHCHLHVIPRFSGDGFRIRHGSNKNKTTREQLDDNAAQIRQDY